MTTTNLQKTVTSLPAAANMSVTVRGANDRGQGLPSRPIFCLTSDGGELLFYGNYVVVIDQFGQRVFFCFMFCFTCDGSELLLFYENNVVVR